MLHPGPCRALVVADRGNMTYISDNEFGEIEVRRTMRSRALRVSVSPKGVMRASAPSFTPMFVIRKFIDSSREDLRKIMNHYKPTIELKNGAKVGRSHTLAVIWGSKTTIKITESHVIVHLKQGDTLDKPAVAKKVRAAVQETLRTEAKAYLPGRLKQIASEYGFSYARLRFSHASTRWGSCSSTGTISLNIALMKLPDTLIDYVLAHELSHTKHMNHSTQFWSLVESIDPKYKEHRRLLKRQNPTI